MADHKDNKASLLSQWKKRANVQGSNESNRVFIPRTEDSVPSDAQKRLWVLQQMDVSNPYYQHGQRYDITGDLNLDVLTESFQRLLGDHEIFSTNFVRDPDLRLTFDKHDVSLFEIDYQDASDANDGSEAEILAYARAPFDLQHDQLIRAKVWKLAHQKFVLVISIHHIIGDRWSLNIMNQQLLDYYRQILAERAYLPIESKVRYRDYAAWKSKIIASENTKGYWKDQIGEYTGVLDLPSSLPRPATLSYHGATIDRKLPLDLVKGVKEIAAMNNTTTYVVLLAVFKVLLYRYTDAKSISVGTPFSTRDRAELESVVGFFTDTLVLRADVSSEITFISFLAEVREMTTSAFAHQDISYDELVQEIKPVREPNRNPLFQVMYINDKQMDGFDTKDLPFDMVQSAIDLKVAKFDLTLFSREGKDEIDLSLEYMTDVVDHQSANRLLSHFINILQSIVSDQHKPVGKLSYLTESEVEMYVDTYNDNAIDIPQYQHLVEAIKSQATDMGAIAAVDVDVEITYAELFSKANHLSERLRTSGVKQGSAVGIFLPKRSDYIISIMAVLQSGCYYVPLDAEYPEERLKYIIQDANISHVISDAAISVQLQSQRNLKVVDVMSAVDEVIMMADGPKISIQPDDYAYLIYTSGSTGHPKGVRVTHRNLMTSTFARYSFYQHRSESFMLFSPFSFDSSVAGIFWTLSQGGKLVIPPYRVEQDVQMVGRLLAEHSVTHTLLLPSLYETLLRFVPAEMLQSLNTVIVAGEECRSMLVVLHHQILTNARLYNEYGPTEASVWCIACELENKEYAAIPIGRSIPNYQVYLLDGMLELVPSGVTGQIYVGGAGLTKGYLGRPEVTAEKFVVSPFNENEKLYATGDLARYDQDGQIYFLGRADDQVKIRGHRIELDEIANRAIDIDGVRAAVAIVVDSQSGNKSIVCHIETSADLVTSEIKRALSLVLPMYMVPDHIIVTEQLPLLPNGKINKNALTSMPLITEVPNEEYNAPEGDIEIMLQGLWEDILPSSPIGRYDNFFSLGGDSILSIQMVSRIRDAGYLIKPSDIFSHQTIAELAAVCLPINDDQIDEVLPRSMAAPLSELQRAFLFNHLRDPLSDEGQLCLSFRLSGPIDPALYQQAWHMAYQQHDILRTEIQDEDTDYFMAVLEDILPDITVTNVVTEEIPAVVQSIKKREQEEPLDLLSGMSNRLILVTDGDHSHELIWTCHHIYLDGWSCGIVMRDVLHHYDDLVVEKEVKVNVVNSYLTYINWRSKSQMADDYWAELFGGVESVPLVSVGTTSSKPAMRESSISLGAHQVESIGRYCKKKAIAVSTFYEALWCKTLGRLFGTDDVSYGVTSSGRNVDYPMINDSVGLYMNIIPHRVSDMPATFDLLCSKMQQMQGSRSAYESSSLLEIGQAISPISTYNLYDSLFVFGNFMRDGLTVGSVRIEGFEGGFSSTLPLTMHVDPQTETVITVKYDEQNVTKEQTIYILKMLQSFIAEVLGEITEKSEFQNIEGKIWDTTSVRTMKAAEATTSQKSDVRETTVDRLRSIWKSVLGLDSIDPSDNFFEMGGTSVQALQVFADIETVFDKRLHPSILFRSPTVGEVAQIIDGQGEEHSMVIPMSAGGDRPPFFCLHSGGGHVFFYQELADLISADVPVYSLQPPEYDGGSGFPKSIAEMATLYIEQMKTVQPTGPYRILSTCFSNALSVEIYHQLARVGERLSEIFIIDSSPMFLVGKSEMQRLSKVEMVKTLLAAKRYRMVTNMVSKKLIGRPIFANSARALQGAEIESAEPEVFEPIVYALNGLLENYNWKPIDTRVRLIRSSQFANWTKKDYHLLTWKKIAKKGVHTYTAEGNHVGLFDQPSVRELAEIIDAILNETDGIAD